MEQRMIGALTHDRKGWKALDYQRIDGVSIGHWLENRVYEIPEGATVELALIVLDPERVPLPPRPKVVKPPAVEF